MNHDPSALHPHHAALRQPDGSWRYTNALLKASSPYLRQHAHNPVDWLPWGESAHDQARRSRKPIFLSIGYSTCYWCHVMERQVFEDPAIAAIMNEHFVNIKVDREERPDLDDLYMTATQLMTRRGGWPMSVFLTPPGAEGAEDPGLRPFWCGTYLPPRPAHGLASFPQVLDALSEAWRERPKEVCDQARQLAEAVAEQLAAQNRPGPLPVTLVPDAVRRLLQSADGRHGGFGGAPKFPQPTHLGFLLEVHRRRQRDLAGSPQQGSGEGLWGPIAQALDRMARGGIYDQIGGGFHRYATDAAWQVPHFEKMLYDNGLLLGVYAEAWALRRAEEPADPLLPLLEAVIRETAGYLQREMTDATGAFWSAQDAEVQAREGANYLWHPHEVRAAFAAQEPELVERALRLYGLDLPPQFEDPHDPGAASAHVLHQPQPLEILAMELGCAPETLRCERQKINSHLLAVRLQREAPATDTKILTSWNGLAIAGLARAGRLLEDAALTDQARAAAEAILSRQVGEGGSLQRCGDAESGWIAAFLEDHAFLVAGLLELARADADWQESWLNEAEHWMAVVESLFADDRGAFFDTRAGQADLFVRSRGHYDGATPSGNSQMLHNLVDLLLMTGNPDYGRRAISLARAFALELGQAGLGMIHMTCGILRLMEAAEEAAEALAAGADPEEGDAQESEETQAWLDEPVTVALEPVDLQGRQWQLQLLIMPGYELTAPVRESEALANSAAQEFESGLPLALELLDAPGWEMLIRWPKAREETEEGGEDGVRRRLYRGRVIIPLQFSRVQPADDQEEVAPRLQIRFQACSVQGCQLPQTLELPLEH